MEERCATQQIDPQGAKEREAFERQRLVAQEHRQYRLSALQLASALAEHHSGDHQAVIRAARDFIAFIEE